MNVLVVAWIIIVQLQCLRGAIAAALLVVMLVT